MAGTTDGPHDAAAGPRRSRPHSLDPGRLVSLLNIATLTTGYIVAPGSDV